MLDTIIIIFLLLTKNTLGRIGQALRVRAPNLTKEEAWCFHITKCVIRAYMLLLVKCHENKMVKLPCNWVIFPLT